MYGEAVPGTTTTLMLWATRMLASRRGFSSTALPGSPETTPRVKYRVRWTC